jgi:hypothetical protein
LHLRQVVFFARAAGCAVFDDSGDVVVIVLCADVGASGANVGVSGEEIFKAAPPFGSSGVAVSMLKVLLCSTSILAISSWVLDILPLGSLSLTSCVRHAFMKITS